jgi:hypothetical protein
MTFDILYVLMSIGRDYVSELRPPGGLLFIPQMICEYVDLQLNGSDRGNFLFVHLNSLTILPTEIAKQEKHREGNVEVFPTKYLFLTYTVL